VPASVAINFYDPEVSANLWPYYDQLRAAGRVVYNETLDVWHVHRYRDVLAVLTDTTHFSSRAHLRVAPWSQPSMITADPPEHQRLRNPLQAAFTKRELRGWESRVTGLIDDLFDEYLATSAPGAPSDIVDGFIWHIPSVVIAEMMGIKPGDRDEFHHWTEDIVAGVGAVVDPSDAARVRQARADEASGKMHRLLTEELARRRSQPTDDLLGQAIAANNNGAISDDEMIATAVLLLMAGNDTTAKLLAQCVVKLRQFPDQRRLVARDPTLIPAAIEEVLRYEQLSGSFPRLVLGGPIEVGEEEIPNDVIVWAMTTMANHDPEVFDRPDQLDVRRVKSAAHLGFGYGEHLCLGANLARIEVRLGLERILRRFPEYEVLGYELSKGWSVRGPAHIEFVGQPAG
jgi:cytochrome P450